MDPEPSQIFIPSHATKADGARPQEIEQVRENEQENQQKKNGQADTRQGEVARDKTQQETPKKTVVLHGVAPVFGETDGQEKDGIRVLIHNQGTKTNAPDGLPLAGRVSTETGKQGPLLESEQQVGQQQNKKKTQEGNLEKPHDSKVSNTQTERDLITHHAVDKQKHMETRSEQKHTKRTIFLPKQGVPRSEDMKTMYHSDDARLAPYRAQRKAQGQCLIKPTKVHRSPGSQASTASVKGF